jgi:hypothetical protein
MDGRAVVDKRTKLAHNSLRITSHVSRSKNDLRMNSALLNIPPELP